MKRLLPRPIFAGGISAACLLVGALFAEVVFNAPRCWPIAIPSVLCFAVALTMAFVAFAGAKQRAAGKVDCSSDVQRNKPTFAIIVLLIGVYSWMLTLGMYVFDAFFKHGAGPAKYYVTLGIAVSSTLFIQLYGKQVVRQHFGTRGGRNLELGAAQAVYVVMFLVGCCVYVTWLMS